MKLVTFYSNDIQRLGVVDDAAGLVRDLSSALPPETQMLDVIERWAYHAGDAQIVRLRAERAQAEGEGCRQRILW